MNSKNRYKYYGYLIANDEDEAANVFNKEVKDDEMDGDKDMDENDKN
jgi:hypothetical protein